MFSFSQSIVWEIGKLNEMNYQYTASITTTAEYVESRMASVYK